MTPAFLPESRRLRRRRGAHLFRGAAGRGPAMINPTVSVIAGKK
jgi:hypothetical protein